MAARLSVLVTVYVAHHLVDALRIAFVSDMHYDPFYGTADAFTEDNAACSSATARLGTPGCDSPQSLLVSAFDDVARVGRPDYVILGGDWERHGTVPSSASSAYRTLAQIINNFTLSVVPCPAVTPLGNNDFVPDYYFDITAPAPPLLNEMAQHLVTAGILHPSENATFASAGYYARRIPTDNLTVLVLNTLIWSKDLDPVVATGADPLGQFSFAQSVVVEARQRGDKVLILSHIPPTMNFFAVSNHADDYAKATREFYMQPQYETAYVQFLKNNSDIFVAQVFAHTHRFSFSAAADMASVPLIVLSAVSPVYSNNPNYMIAEYNATLGRLTRMQQRYLPITEDGDSAMWTWGLTLPDAYGGPSAPLDSAFFSRVSQLLAANVTAQATFAKMYAGGVNDNFDAFCWKLMSCFMGSSLPADTFACAFSTSSLSPTTTAAPVVSFVPTTESPNTTAPPHSGASPIRSNVLIIVVVAGGATVLALIAVLFAVLRRRRSVVTFEAIASETQLN